MKISKFQIVILAIFIVCLGIGIYVFATYKGGGSSSTQLAPITIWGTFPADVFDKYIAEINQTLATRLSVTYVQKNRMSFSQEFIAALARGTGPDAILIPADTLLPHFDKITSIPYTALAQRTFMDTYVNEGQMYLTTNGIQAIPFIVDPLVMYWNKDIFTTAGLATYPKNWEEFADLNKKITVKDENSNIRKATIAMGDFSNVLNSRELLGTLFMQAGNPVTAVNTDGVIASTVKNVGSGNVSGAVNLFTQFINPNGDNYSWSKAMLDSKKSFLAQTLSVYFGFASELADIRAKNPNLNFDVAPIPQWKASKIQTTYGRMYGFSIVRASQNQNAAYQIFAVLTSPTNLARLSQLTYLPSVNLSVIAAGSSDPYITIFNRAALTGRTWFDVDPNQSYTIFSNMISAVTSGSKTVTQALNDASDQFDVALGQAQSR